MRGIPIGKETERAIFKMKAVANTARSIGKQEVENERYHTIPFIDVSTTSWYYNAVRWAYQNNLTSGTSPDTFSPNLEIKRQDAIIMLYKFACLSRSYSVDPTLIEDVSDYSNVSEYAYEAMSWALGYCVLQPDGSNKVYPKTKLIRAQQALFICRYEKNAVGFFDGKKKFSFLNDTAASNNLTGTMKSRLLHCVNDMFPESIADEITIAIRAHLSSSGGKCFGMSCTMLFDAIGRIDFNKNVGNYASMNAVPSYTADACVLSGINFYSSGEVAAAQFRQRVDTSAKLNAMYNDIRKTGPTLLSFYWYDSDAEELVGHTVVILSMQPYSSGAYIASYLDPNYTGIRSSYISTSWFAGYSLSRLYYYPSSNMKLLYQLDADGTYNTLSITN